MAMRHAAEAIAPIGDPDYYRARPTIGLPKSQVIAGDLQIAFALPEVVRRLGFDGELVEREMFGAEGESFLQFVPPLQVFGVY